MFKENVLKPQVYYVIQFYKVRQVKNLNQKLGLGDLGFGRCMRRLHLFCETLFKWKAIRYLSDETKNWKTQ